MTNLAVFGFLAFLCWVGITDFLRARKRREKPVKIEAGALAVMVEQQAKLDLQTFAIRMLIKTHPQAYQLEGILRTSAPEFVKTQEGLTPEATALYAESIDRALEGLLCD